MHILHIVNSYGGTEVYKNLFTALDIKGIEQTIFVPLNPKNHNRIGKQKIQFNCSNSRIIYSTELKNVHKFCFKLKIKTIVNDVCKLVDFSKIDIIHAHMLCVDGTVAYELSRKFSIPYFSAIRNTDLNFYYRYFFLHKNYFNKVALNAKRILFISPVYQKKYLNNYFSKKERALLNTRFMVIPNGIKNCFLQKKITKKKLNLPIRVLFVGAFKKGKGLLESIEAINILRNKGYNIEFDAIGKGLPFRGIDSLYESKIDALSLKFTWLKIYNFLSADELVSEIRKRDIFVMPSRPETFGLVYVEALTQKLPVIYSSGEGFDGFFEEGQVGYSVNCTDIVNIADKIELIIQNYDKIQNQIDQIDLRSKFSWENIAETYLKLYKE